MGSNIRLRDIGRRGDSIHSDWAGCKDTRKSSSAGVMMLRDHALKAFTRKQKIIARSYAEAELYAAALGASESKRDRVVVERSGIRDEASVGS